MFERSLRAAAKVDCAALGPFNERMEERRSGDDRRQGGDRRTGTDRRKTGADRPGDRRKGGDRRTGDDRRKDAS
jgi:hypothetical protein